MCERAALIPGRLLAGELEPLLAHAADCASCRAALLEQGAWPPGCSDPRRGHQVLLHLELLARPGGGGAQEPREHLEACPACAAEVEEAAAALGALGAKELVAAAPEPIAPHAIALACTFCHDRLARELAAFCAACLAPHHAGCFAEHGRCAAPGCAERRWVRPREAPSPRRRLLRRAGLTAAAVLLAAGAALVELRQVHSPEPLRRVERAAVARVGGEQILWRELDLACRLDPAWALLPSADIEGRRRLRLERLEELVEENALWVLARFDGVELTPRQTREVQQRVEAERQHDEALRALSPEDALLHLARQWRRELVAEHLRRQAPAEDPAPGELERWWEAHPVQRGGLARLQEVVLLPRLEDAAPVPLLVAAWVAAEGRWDPAACARELLRRVRAGETSFGEVASGASMRPRGGEELAVRAEELLPALAGAVERLEPGQVSEAILAYTGSVHLLRLVAREGARLVPLSEAREQALAGWREERRRAARREQVRRARLSVAIEVPDLAAALADEPTRGGAR